MAISAPICFKFADKHISLYLSNWFSHAERTHTLSLGAAVLQIPHLLLHNVLGKDTLFSNSFVRIVLFPEVFELIKDTDGLLRINFICIIFLVD